MASKLEFGRVQDLLYWLLRNSVTAKELEEAVSMARERKYSNTCHPLQVYADDLAGQLLED